MQKANKQKHRRLWLGIVIFLFAIGTTEAQMQTNKRCGKKQSKSTNTSAMIASPETYQKVELPPDYKPPVAKKESYVFRETYASKRQRKIMRKQQSLIH